jgi:hypothetical protein
MPVQSGGLFRTKIPLPIASGDLRNIIKTVAHLPSSYNHSLKVTINDKDFNIMAHNLILLLVALVIKNPIRLSIASFTSGTWLLCTN